MTIFVLNRIVIFSNNSLFLPKSSLFVLLTQNGPIKERKTVLGMAEQMESKSNQVGVIPKTWSKSSQSKFVHNHWLSQPQEPLKFNPPCTVALQPGSAANLWLMALQVGTPQLFHAGATVGHFWTILKVKIQLDHYCIGDGSYIDFHRFIWA